MASAPDPAPLAKLQPARQLAKFAQFASGLAGFFRLGDLALTGFFAPAGFRLSGLPAWTDVTAGSGSGRKNTRQPGLSCDLFRTMQTVTRSTSGISVLQSRNASSEQACCSSGV